MILKAGDWSVSHIRVHTVIHTCHCCGVIFVILCEEKERKMKNAIFFPPIIFSPEFLFWNSSLLVTKVPLRLFGACPLSCNSTTDIISGSKAALPPTKKNGSLLSGNKETRYTCASLSYPFISCCSVDSRRGAHGVNYDSTHLAQSLSVLSLAVGKECYTHFWIVLVNWQSRKSTSDTY